MSQLNEHELPNGPRGFKIFSPGQLSGEVTTPINHKHQKSFGFSNNGQFESGNNETSPTSKGNSTFEEESVKAMAIKNLTKFIKDKKKEGKLEKFKNFFVNSPSPIRPVEGFNNTVAGTSHGFGQSPITPKAPASFTSNLWAKQHFGTPSFGAPAFSHAGTQFSTSTPKPTAAQLGQSIKKPRDLDESSSSMQSSVCNQRQQTINKDEEPSSSVPAAAHDQKSASKTNEPWPLSPAPDQSMGKPAAPEETNTEDSIARDQNLSTAFINGINQSFVNFMNNSDFREESVSAKPYQDILGRIGPPTTLAANSVNPVNRPISMPSISTESDHQQHLEPNDDTAETSEAPAETGYANDSTLNILGDEYLAIFGIASIDEDQQGHSLGANLDGDSANFERTPVIPEPLHPPLDTPQPSDKVQSSNKVPPPELVQNEIMEVGEQPSQQKEPPTDLEGIGGWVSMRSSKGERYYYSRNNGESKWDQPQEWTAELRRRNLSRFITNNPDQPAAAMEVDFGADGGEFALQNAQGDVIGSKTPIVAKRVGTAKRGAKRRSGERNKQTREQQQGKSTTMVEKQSARKRKATEDEPPIRTEKAPFLVEDDDDQPVGSGLQQPAIRAARRVIVSDDEEETNEGNDSIMDEIVEESDHEEEKLVCPPPIFQLPVMPLCEVHVDFLTDQKYYELTGHYPSTQQQQQQSPRDNSSSRGSQSRRARLKNPYGRSVKKPAEDYNNTTTTLDDDDDSSFAESPASSKAASSEPKKSNTARDRELKNLHMDLNPKAMDVSLNANTSFSRELQALGEGSNTYWCVDCGGDMNFLRKSNYLCHLIRAHQKFIDDPKPVNDYLRTLKADQICKIKFACEFCETYTFKGENGLQQLNAHKREKHPNLIGAGARRKSIDETAEQIIARIFAEARAEGTYPDAIDAEEYESNNDADTSLSYHTAGDITPVANGGQTPNSEDQTPNGGDQTPNAGIIAPNDTITLGDSIMMNESVDENVLVSGDDDEIVCLDTPPAPKVKKQRDSKKEARYSSLMASLKQEIIIEESPTVDKPTSSARSQNFSVAGTSSRAETSVSNPANKSTKYFPLFADVNSTSASKTPKRAKIGESPAFRFRRAPRYESTPNANAGKARNFLCPHCPPNSDAMFGDQLLLNKHIVSEHGVGAITHNSTSTDQDDSSNAPITSIKTKSKIILDARKSTASSISDDSQQPSTSKNIPTETKSSKVASDSTDDNISPRRSLPARKAKNRESISKPVRRRSERFK